LRGDEELENVIYPHPHGFKVVPASMNVNDLIGVEPEKLIEVTTKLNGKCDILLLDSAPGLGKEAVSSIQAADEILLITNPTIASVADALKTLKVAEALNKKILGVVVNRISGNKHELDTEKIEEMIGKLVIAEIPEDIRVHESNTIKTSVIDYRPYSPASLEIKRLSHYLTEREFENKRPGIFNRIFKRIFG
jgi:MinD-like ATPase involved in chromosome partitioning or flagellar assembly